MAGMSPGRTVAGGSRSLMHAVVYRWSLVYRNHRAEKLLLYIVYGRVQIFRQERATATTGLSSVVSNSR